MLNINYIIPYPDGTAGCCSGSSVVIIKDNIRNHVTEKYCEDYFQAASVVIEDWAEMFTIFAIYSLPKHTIEKEHISSFSTSKHFIAAGDYNAKHVQ